MANNSSDNKKNIINSNNGDDDDENNENSSHGGSKESLEKTSIISSDTFKRGIQAADNSPPVLVVLIGPTGYVGKQFALTQTDLVLGRSIENQIYIDDRSLSRSHAKFVLVGSDISIVDLGSTNKTVINGKELTALQAYQLKNNDQIKTGSIIFKFLEKGNIEAISNQAVYEKVQKDALTGIYSRGALMEKGPEAMKRAEVLSEPMSLIIFDIDFFKKINDTYGHPAGDYVLKHLCHLISSKVIRSNDFFARFGGEEFVLLISGGTKKIALEVAERIRYTVESAEFIFEKKKIPVTISVGVTLKQESDNDWMQLNERADKALYSSKQGGRNRVTML